MSFEQSSDPTVMATPPVPPIDPPGFNPGQVEPPKKKKTWLIVLVIVLVLCCCCLLIGGAGYWLYQNGAIESDFQFDFDDFSYLLPYFA